jgi:hypothetical protein
MRKSSLASSRRLAASNSSGVGGRRHAGYYGGRGAGRHHAQRPVHHLHARAVEPLAHRTVDPLHLTAPVLNDLVCVLPAPVAEGERPGSFASGERVRRTTSSPPARGAGSPRARRRGLAWRSCWRRHRRRCAVHIRPGSWSRSPPDRSRRQEPGVHSGVYPCGERERRSGTPGGYLLTAHDPQRKPSGGAGGEKWPEVCTTQEHRRILLR